VPVEIISHSIRRNISDICSSIDKDMQRTYKILMHKEPEGCYTVSVPALPGCITYGETVEHALQMANEAIELYVAELSERAKLNRTLQYL
jgi:antitoxin HicB